MNTRPGEYRATARGRVVGSLSCSPSSAGQTAAVFVGVRREPCSAEEASTPGAPGAGHHLHGLLGVNWLAERRWIYR